MSENLASRAGYGDLRDSIIGPLSLPPKRDYDQEERAALVLVNLRDAPEEFLVGAAAFLLVMARSYHLPTRLVGLELSMAFHKLKPDGKIAGWLRSQLKVESDLLKSAELLAEDASRIVQSWFAATKGERALSHWLFETESR